MPNSGGGTFNTTGTIDVAAGQTFYIDARLAFTIQGGIILNSGTMIDGIDPNYGCECGSGGLAAEGGSETGNPIEAWEANASFGGTGSGAFTLEGYTGATIAGDIAAGYTVIIDGGAPEGGARYTTSGDVTNHGTLELTDRATSGVSEALLDIPSGSTLTNEGTIISDPGADGTGTRILEGDVTNDGTLDVNFPLKSNGDNFGVASFTNTGQFTNAGTVSIASGQSYSVIGSYLQTSGTTVLGGAGAAIAPTTGMLLQGGTLSGSGTVNGNLTNDGGISPSPSPATLTVAGNYTQPSTGLLSLTNTATGSDRLNVTGTASLGGTVQVTTAPGFAPALGSTYEVLTAASVSGTFATAADAGIYAVSYNPSNVTLTTIASPGSPSPAVLSIGSATVEAPVLGAASATFTVTLSAALATPVTVAFATADGTGVAGTDYQATSGKLTLSPGVTEQSVTVHAIGGIFGPAKTFFVDLSSPSGAVLGVARGTGTITHQPSSVGGDVSPSTGGRGGTVTVTIQGKGLYGSPRVALTATGQPDIVATAVSVAADGSSVIATFDLTGAPLGVRTVGVTEPGATGSEALTGAFTIVPGLAPEISAQIVGEPAIGPGATWYGELVYQNVGNTNAYGTLVEVSGFPEGTDVKLGDGSDLPLAMDADHQREITFGIPQIGALASGAVPLSFVAQGASGSTVNLQVHVVQTSPDPRAGPDPSVSVTPTFTTLTADEIAGTLNVVWSGGSDQVSFDITPAPAPADGMPHFTLKTSGSAQTFTAILPPAPAPAPFGASCGGVAALAGAAAERPAGSVAPVSACALPVFAAARRTLTGEPTATAAGGGDGVKVTEVDPKGALDKINDALNLWDKWQAASVLKQLTACLAAKGYISGDGHGPGLLGTDSQQDVLDTNANAVPAAAALTLAADFVKLNPVAGALAGQAGAALQEAADSAWGQQLQQLTTDNTYGPPYPFKLGLAGADAASTLRNAFKICPPAPPPACKKLGATVSDGRFAHDSGDCGSSPPPPPDPPPFPIQIRSSHDPNAIIGPSGAGAAHWVRGASTLPFTYTTLFQNEASATAPAYQVLITDRLDPTRLNLATLSLGPIRFGTHAIAPPAGIQAWSTQVDLRPGKDELVDVSASLDRATGVLSWNFATIDAATGQPLTDPFNGFLPPDTAPPAGDGSVSFSVVPKAALKTATKIENAAAIVFDKNAPILTPTWVNTVDLSHPTSAVVRVRPGLATVKEFVKQRIKRHRAASLLAYWRGVDRYSGVAAFDVYVAAGRGRFTKVISATPQLHGTFVCVPGRSYRFYTVAHSAVGNPQIGHGRPSKAVRCG